jgi:hypothetical protein
MLVRVFNGAGANSGLIAGANTFATAFSTEALRRELVDPRTGEHSRQLYEGETASVSEVPRRVGRGWH